MINCSHQLARKQWIGKREKKYEYWRLADLYQYYSFSYFFLTIKEVQNEFRQNEKNDKSWNSRSGQEWQHTHYPGRKYVKTTRLLHQPFTRLLSLNEKFVKSKIWIGPQQGRWSAILPIPGPCQMDSDCQGTNKFIRTKMRLNFFLTMVLKFCFKILGLRILF